MTKMKALLFAAGLICIASPAMAGWFWTDQFIPGPQGWLCARYEYAKRCNAELSPHRNRCVCITR